MLISQSLSLAVEILSILNVVDFAQKLVSDGLGGLQLLKRLADHDFEVVVGLFDLRDVDGLQL